MSGTLELIKSRRSVRRFSDEALDDRFVERVLEAGAWAPSGLNNQPWAFAVVKALDTRRSIAGFTQYKTIIESAPVLICVFLDTEKMYDRTKDCQAIGACIQNMLLYIHSEGKGAVWMGEILKNKDAVAEILGAPPHLELMAVVALGRPDEDNIHEGRRRPVAESVFYKS